MILIITLVKASFFTSRTFDEFFIFLENLVFSNVHEYAGDEGQDYLFNKI